MAEIYQTGQNQHDRILNKVVGKLRSKGLSVKTNPGKEKNHGVSVYGETIWPDTFVYQGNTITQIYEVETKQTTNEGSVNQWEKYSRGNYEFYLVVPEVSLQKVKELVSRFGVKVTGYWIFRSGG